MLLATIAFVGSADAKELLIGQASPGEARLPLDQIEHTPWHTLLQRFVDSEGRVNYRSWHADTGARAALTSYLESLGPVELEAAAPIEAALAYWINAYNALTIEGILREYPTSSIRNHTATVWGYNLWKDLKLRVADSTVSLDDIEHQRLRPRGDPRIHFAIVCASIGCPRLLNEAYRPETLEAQLEMNARHFFAQSQNFQIDPASNTIHLSAILKWYGEDFGATQDQRLRRITQWLPTNAARSLMTQPNARVSYLEYDWHLNEQP
ncbi:DUF547 domain-containing protein [Botrimarina hoheduenensis]|uniref:DUF547 domain-containing protein n=1 Tax=Botrimarina hoheduenensis TaxID=2528000 RepID=A0A5C5VUE3_9BACT|nr:DUF547 domain-containing protein [Botrimarina hoheduenensis]TWT41535.1 hypothetical protein Pla111_29120 [Botrimarina hoheduenensis]